MKFPKRIENYYKKNKNPPAGDLRNYRPIAIISNFRRNTLDVYGVFVVEVACVNSTILKSIYTQH